MKLKGILKVLAGSAPTGGEDPEVGVTANGEIFAIQATQDSGGAVTPVATIDVVSIVTTTNAITDTASAVLSADTTRKTLEFFNQDPANSVFLAFEGVTATTAFWELLPQAYYSPPLITQGAVSAICDTSLTATLLINVGT